MRLDLNEKRCKNYIIIIHYISLYKEYKYNSLYNDNNNS